MLLFHWYRVWCEVYHYLVLIYNCVSDIELDIWPERHDWRSNGIPSTDRNLHLKRYYVHSDLLLSLANLRGRQQVKDDSIQNSNSHLGTLCIVWHYLLCCLPSNVRFESVSVWIVFLNSFLYLYGLPLLQSFTSQLW